LTKAAAEVTKWKIACEQEQVKLIKTLSGFLGI
jgi:hypothetical protein